MLGRKIPNKPLDSRKRIKRELEYVRHGTSSLFAAINVDSGTKFGRARNRQTRLEFIDFFEQISELTPNDKMVHAVLDKLSTHKTKEEGVWLDW